MRKLSRKEKNALAPIFMNAFSALTRTASLKRAGADDDLLQYQRAHQVAVEQASEIIVATGLTGEAVRFLALVALEGEEEANRYHKFPRKYRRKMTNYINFARMYYNSTRGRSNANPV